MRNNKSYKNFSSEFVAKLVDYSAGYLSPDTFDKVIQAFESEISRQYFSFSAESNLLRIIQAMYDKPALLKECIQYHHYVEILISISINSNYLTDILVRNPEYFYSIVNPSVIEMKTEKEKFLLSIRQTLSVYKSFNSKVNALRALKRKEILRIGVKDIWAKADLNEITGELSIIAVTIASELFTICYNEILLKHGIKKPKRTYCLAALGKLGGGELNYSSDIDLIIFYDKNSIENNNLYFNELLTETIYLFIKSSSSITENGFLYRVDFRLRPDGRNSPLCRSITEYLNYYESRGEDWERQMLIKAGFVSGSKNLYDSFINYLQPFIYPVSFTSSPTDQIKKLKQNIEKRLNEEEDIKLLPGGIRDIEFAVQALQLLNGGKNPELRTGNTLGAVKKLTSAGLLSVKESETLNKAYILYRCIEHYLQLMNDIQTHTIPAGGELLEKLSSFLGFKNSIEFKKFVNFNRREVKKISDSVLNLNSFESRQAQTNVPFNNQKLAKKNLQYLSEGKGLLGNRQFDSASINLFREIENDLDEYLANSKQPDLVLQNFVRVVKSISLPSIWYREFKDKAFFKKFLYLCEYSQKAIDLFAEDDELREFFITRKVFERIIAANIHTFNTKKILFTLTVQFGLNIIPSLRVSEVLSEFAIFSIKKEACNSLQLKKYENEFTIGVMGSCGAGEMSFASDIDLIFIVNNLNSYPEIQKDFQELLLRLKTLLNPFDVDCRLRPEGKSSILVWDLNSYKNYVLKRTRVWELQAFCKLRYASGNKKIISSLSYAINQRIKAEDKLNVKKEIYEMRKKLYPQAINSVAKSFNVKKSRGGLTDIEFAVQYLILTGENLFSKCRGKNLPKIFHTLEKLMQVPDVFNLWRSNFLFLNNLTLTIQAAFNKSISLLSLNDDKISIVSYLLGFDSPDKFKDKLNDVINSNQTVFDKYLL